MDDQRKAQEQRNAANNAENIRNAADVAIASKVPHAVAAGAAVKAADAVTGGKGSELAGKTLAKANEIVPGGNTFQNNLNHLNESGLGQKAGQAARTYNGMKGKPGKGSELAKEPTGNNMDTIGRGRDEPSSNVNNAQVQPGTANGNKPTEDDKKEKRPRIAGIGPFGRQPGDRSEENNNNDEEQEENNKYSLMGSKEKRIIIALSIPLIVVLVFILFISLVVFVVEEGDFDDALGAANASGEDLGISGNYDGGSKDAEDYYERINNVKLEFQAQGKSFDSTDVAAVFHVLMNNGAELEYKDISEDKIREVADALFSGNSYDRESFKEKLKNIIPKYLPKKSSDEIDDITQEIDEYVQNYYEYIEKKEESYANFATGCATGATCNYDIKGFYVNGKNIAKPMQISNLKVRLMQCGSPYGNGNDNTPIKQNLVDFEDYVGGVAYAELGDNQPLEAYKAQLVMARSFALARPTAMGNAGGKKLSQENGQWVLQIASCVSDQVFCNIEQGCSYMGGGDGQGGYVVSGTNVPGSTRSKGPLSDSSPLKLAMAATKGEVLTNNQGYIIGAGYNSASQKSIISLANNGLDYKQILFKKYSNAKNIDKMSCSNSTNCKMSTGDFINWKQCGSPWSGVRMGNSGSNICGIGCLVTSVSMLIAKSGVQTTVPNFNPGSFVEYLNRNGGFADGGNFIWASTSGIAPGLKYQGKIGLSGLGQKDKFNRIKQAVDSGAYLACEVKGNTGQHWVAVDSVQGNQIVMLDPGSRSNNMWQEYNWANTSECATYRLG